MKFNVLVVVLILFNSALVQAIALPPVPTTPIYFEPPIINSTEDIRKLSCVELDNNIRTLHPYRYSYKPGFYQDNANKIATGMVVMDSLPLISSIPIIGEVLGFSYLTYSALVEEKEQRRTLMVEQEIAMFQQVKAEKHCFE